MLIWGAYEHKLLLAWKMFRRPEKCFLIKSILWASLGSHLHLFSASSSLSTNGFYLGHLQHLIGVGPSFLVGFLEDWLLAAPVLWRIQHLLMMQPVGCKTLGSPLQCCETTENGTVHKHHNSKLLHLGWKEASGNSLGLDAECYDFFSVFLCS